MQTEVFTIGHSNHSEEEFIQLLNSHKIQVIVDVRSSPYSKYSRHFNQAALKALLLTARIKYLYFGKEIGGMPQDSQFYDENGYVLYWKIAQTELFKESVARIVKGSFSYKIALMCGEENPFSCHRKLLVARVLKSEGICVKHIRGNGQIELDDNLNVPENDIVQLKLFAHNNSDPEWKSVQPINSPGAPSRKA